jgi:hypothetical protein
MSRAQTRARRRRARIEQAGLEFNRSRNNPAALAALLTYLSDTDQPIWPIAEVASRVKPLDDDERAMVAQAVAPHLAGMTPGSVWSREAKGQSSSPPKGGHHERKVAQEEDRRAEAPPTA